MKNPLRVVFLGAKTVFSQSRFSWLWFAIFTALALGLFVLVPVWSVPGNDLAFQVSLFSFGNWVLFIILALLIGLLLTMQVFVFRRNSSLAVRAKNLGKAATGAIGAYAGILGGVFATAACSWCVAAVFGFLGTGAVLFIAQNQFWAVLAAIGIMLLSLYLTSRSVLQDCERCRVGKNL